MVTGSAQKRRGWWPWALAVLAVLPTGAPAVWSGFRLAVTDPVLSVLAVSEQPLSVRQPAGLWTIGLAATWFGLAYWRRDARWWEAALLLLGGAVALARVGNGWLAALVLLLPLARQLSAIAWRWWAILAVAIAALGATGITLLSSKPPELPRAASDAIQTAQSRGAVFADWRWAPRLGAELGPGREVLAASGLTSQSTDFWLDYLRVVQGHERWAAILAGWQVDLVILDAADQDQKAADLVRQSADWHILYDAAGSLVAQRNAS
jgi:hypothetical protein